MVVMPADRSDSDRGRPEHVAVEYERAVAQAGDLLLAHLKSCPDDAGLSRARHGDDTPTLYAAVVATFPELERMRLTTLMWDQVVQQAFARFHAPPPDAR